MRRRKGKAGSKPTRRFDPGGLRELLIGQGQGQATDSAIGKVVAGDDGNAYDLDVVGGQLKEITAELEIVPTGERVTARLAAAGASPLRGVFGLPEVGDEFLVIFAAGDRSNPIGVIPLSGTELPNSAQQATGGKLLVIGVEVIATNAEGGGEEPLVRRQEFLDHIHGTGTGPSATPTVQAGIGTTVLRGK